MKKRILCCIATVTILALVLCSCGGAKSIVEDNAFTVTKGEIISQLQTDLASRMSETMFGGEECECTAETTDSGLTHFSYSAGSDSVTYDKITVAANSNSAAVEDGDIPDTVNITLACNSNNDDCSACVDNYYVVAGAFLHQIYPDKTVDECEGMAEQMMKDATAAGGDLDGTMENDIPYKAMAYKMTINGIGYLLTISITPSN